MDKLKYVFGPVPSRRLGRSLGISPIPKKTCNYSCIYCQLGRTDKMTDSRQEFFPLADILSEFAQYLRDVDKFDVVSIVGEGEPTLYLKLGALIKEIKSACARPVAVITNGALLYDAQVRSELCGADIVLPSLDAFDEETYRKIDRPCGRLKFDKFYDGLVRFSHEFKGQLYPEIMLMRGFNDSRESLGKFKALLKNLRYDKLYINTPVRPPAESYVSVSSPETMQAAADILGGVPIGILPEGGFFSEITDDYDAVLSIIRRHPMNQHEIAGFLADRGAPSPQKFLDRLGKDPDILKTEYKGYITYRLK